MKSSSKSKPERIGTALKRVIQGCGLESGLARHGIVEVWNSVMDATVRRHAKAEKVVESVLFVDVDSTVWMNELAAIKKTLLDHLNRNLKPPAQPLQDIRFRLARSKKTIPNTKSHPGQSPPPTDEELRLKHLTLKSAVDDEVRSILDRLMEKDRVLKWKRGE
jgi:hypothetical protein